MVYVANRFIGNGHDMAGAQLIDRDALLLECIWGRASADLQQDPAVRWTQHGNARRVAFFTYESSASKYAYTGAAPIANALPVYMWDAVEATINKVVQTGRMDVTQGAVTVLVNEQQLWPKNYYY